MPDTRSHRGPHPEDERLFAPSQLPTLRAAVEDLSWLRTRGYGDNTAREVVGNRYQLTRRQRDAVARSSCADQALALRCAARCSVHACTGERLLIDGFNTLITLESALGGAYLFMGRDGCYRDIGGLRGTYRPVAETTSAIRWAGVALDTVGARSTRWMLDRHVSNAGRLKEALREAAEVNGWDWQVEIADQTDTTLIHTSQVTVTSDSGILDQTERWFNLVEVALGEAPNATNIRRIG